MKKQNKETAKTIEALIFLWKLEIMKLLKKDLILM